MMRSLKLKLFFAFLFTGLVGIVLMFLVTGRYVSAEIRALALDEHLTNFMGAVANSYQRNGTIDGPMGPPGGAPKPRAGNRMGDPLSHFVLTDPDGIIVNAGSLERYVKGEPVSAEELTSSHPVEVDGEIIARVVLTEESYRGTARDALYIDRMYRVLYIAALLSIIAAVVIAVAASRYYLRPLSELTLAIQKMGGGQLQQRVAVRSNDEVGTLVSQFNRMSEDLARSEQTRKNMTAEIAHDLKNPLTIISGYLESLRDGVLFPTPQRLDILYNETQTLQRMVDDLRTLSLADAGKLDLKCVPTPPHVLLERALEAHRVNAEQKKVALETQIDATAPVNVDPQRIAQVIDNLVGNALRHTPEGGKIALAAKQNNNQVTFKVQDSGSGISPALLPHIFERFYHADAAGTGLGLAIVKSIVEAHGGQISVESQPGAGTTFSICLPATG